MLAALVLGSARCGASDGVGILLRERVVVRGAVVRLSDLLPEAAEPALARMAAEFVVGRSPDPGTVMRVNGDRLALRLANDERFRGLRLPAQVLVTRSGYALEHESIVRAIQLFLQRQQIAPLTPAMAAALQWPQDLGTKQAHPELEVTGVYPESGGSELRLRCVLPGACASFLVTVPGMPGVLKFTKPQPEKAGKSGAGAWAAQARAGRPNTAASPILVFAGRPARLLLERDGMRISISVTCLDRGALEQTVRARDPGSGRIFRARVRGPALLEARL